MNHRFKIARYGWTFDRLIRITSKLVAADGVSRMVWINTRGRAYIIRYGDGGYQRTGSGTLHDPFVTTGHVPSYDSIDWNNGGLCELTA